MITINYYPYSITTYNVKLRRFPETPIYNKGNASAIATKLTQAFHITHSEKIYKSKQSKGFHVSQSKHQNSQVFYFRLLELTQAFHVTKAEHQNSHNQTTTRNPVS